ncbi:hemoglobin-like protein [Chthoniobacter flavus Ellin428]|uniref:Hemoglobin-like protein n=1 Tax=Chthoniobacter flavus Ellin428 TaxID=497964 RepID=B4D1F1_9BACT|nr:group III truncated hemoglobin [Chthoniobacter flavus]EDY19563.1 hemoglobin-like protein [Chthoniobacter flavus Ellin428]TCO92807.1 hemoglobin [Chthoniobacter flavus]
MSLENQPPPSSLPDLTGRADIERLVDTFYGKVRQDELIGFIFNDVARTDWAAHLPKMYAFWETVLFRTGNFSGNPLATHARLVPLTTMGPPQFERWLALFTATVDELFAGEKANLLKASAADIANVLHTKINKLPPTPFDFSQLTPEQRAHYASQKPKQITP